MAYPSSPETPDCPSSTNFIDTADITSPERRVGRTNCQDKKAMENNNPAEISFVEKRNKALEFISCHIAENCGNHHFIISRSAAEYSFPIDLKSGHIKLARTLLSTKTSQSERSGMVYDRYCKTIPTWSLSKGRHPN